MPKPNLPEDQLPVEGPENPEDYELRDDLLRVLDEETEKELAAIIESDHRDALSDRQEWEERLRQDEEQYLGILPSKDFPWVGCANFNVPLTMLGVETLKPRLVESVWGSDPPLYVIPIEGADEERRDRVDLFLNWQIRTELDLRPLVEESSHLFLIPGTVVAKTVQEREVRTVKVIRTYPATTPVEQIVATAFGGTIPPEAKQAGPLEWTAKIKDPGHAPRKIRVKLATLDNAIQVLIERDEIVFEGPRVYLIPPEDFIVPARGPKNPNESPWCQHRLWLYEDDLRRLVAQGVLNEEAVDDLINHRNAPSGEEGQLDSTGIREIRAEAQGVEPFGGSNVRNNQYEVWEDYRRWDIDEDGLTEEIVAWRAPELPDKLLGWDYLDNRCAHGRRPFRVGRYQARPFEFYGLSFAHIIGGIQDEINTIHNQRVDFGTIQNTPIFIYRASATAPSSVYKIRPGEGIPVDDPSRDFQIPRWGGTPSFGQAEEALLYQYFERLTGITDLALGRQPNRVGATRTATGVSSLLSEAGLRFKIAMEGFQAFWVGIFEDILALDQAHLPPGKEFRVTGRWPEIIRLESREEIAGRYDIRLSATTEALNRSITRENVTVRFQALFNPALLQLGFIGPKGLRKTLKDFLRAFGEPDPELILEPSTTQTPRTPEEELAIFLAGGDIEPVLSENLPIHLDTHANQLRDPAVLERLGQAGAAKLERHLSKTLQLLQIQNIIMGGAGGGKGGGPATGSQAVNAQTGRQQAQSPSNSTQEQTAATGGSSSQGEPGAVRTR